MMNVKTSTRKYPRGIRNKNPGNIRHSPSKWQGRSTVQNDPAFVQFDNPVYGLRALMKLVLTYQRKYELKTVQAIIDRWAPPVENNTSAYVDRVAEHLVVDPTQPIDLENPSILIELTKAIVLHENGSPHKYGAHKFWYPQAQYIEAVKLALGPQVLSHPTGENR